MSPDLGAVAVDERDAGAGLPGRHTSHLDALVRLRVVYVEQPATEGSNRMACVFEGSATVWLDTTYQFPISAVKISNALLGSTGTSTVAATLVVTAGTA